MIKLDGISVDFEKRSVLKDFSCEIGDGSFVLIKGANGSGKTTLGKILAGEFYDYSGEYFFDGDKVDEKFEIFKKAAMIKANAKDNFVFGIVKDEIAFALKNLKQKKKEIRYKVAETAELFGIGHLLNRLTSELSEGERQLTALASFMVFSPKVLILDEALASVDEEHRKKIMNYLKELAEKEGRTFIYISNINEDEKFFSKVISLGGKNIEPIKIGAEKLGRPVINLTDFTVIKKKKEVLSGIGMSIREGEAVAITAPNASGKTTLVTTIAGFNNFKGVYMLSGQEVINKAQIYKEVGIVFQAAENFLSKATPLKELTQNAELSDAMELAKRIGIEELLDRPMEELSTGEKRIVAVACALIKKPKLLILDEVLSSLSGEYKSKLLELLKKLCDNKLAVILISHDNKEAEKIASRVWKLTEPFKPAKEKNVVLGRCLPGKTVVHKTPAAVKILIAIAFTACVFIFSNWWVLLGFGVFTLLTLILARISPKSVFLYTRHLFILTAFVFALNWLTINLDSALLVLTRLSLVNIFVPIVSLTSTPGEIMNVLSFPILPFKWCRKMMGNFGAVCTMAVACLPEGNEFTKNIICWQRSLGIVYSKKKFYMKAVQRAQLFVPLLLFLKKNVRSKADVFVAKGFNFGA